MKDHDIQRIVDASPNYNLTRQHASGTQHVYAVGDRLRVTCTDRAMRAGTVARIDLLAVGPTMTVDLDTPYPAPRQPGLMNTTVTVWLSDDLTTVTGPTENTRVELIHPDDDPATACTCTGQVFIECDCVGCLGKHLGCRPSDVDLTTEPAGEPVDISTDDGVHRKIGQVTDPNRVEQLSRLIADHLHTCNQDYDPCYQTSPDRGETWRDVVERRADHLARIIHAHTP